MARRHPGGAINGPNAFVGEMWPHSVGKMCVLSGDHLKEAIPANDEAFRNGSVTAPESRSMIKGRMRL